MSKFRDAMNDYNNNNKLHEAVLKSYNKNAPNGFKYCQHENECYATLTPIDDKCNIKCNIDIPKNIPINSTQELQEYLYRTQQSIAIKDDSVLLNNQSFNIRDLLKSPYINCAAGVKLIIKPEAFPLPIDIPMKFGNMEKVIKFQRKPYNSMNHILFQSINNNELIDIKYIVDEKNSSINFKFNFNYNNAKSITDLIQGCKIYKGFLDNKVYVLNDHISTKKDNAKSKYIKSILQILYKLSDISKIIKMNFKPTMNFTNEEIETINALYRCLVEEKSYKDFASLNSLTFESKDKIDKNIFSKSEGQCMGFSDKVDIDLLNVTVNLYRFQSFVNIKVIDVKELEKNPYKYKLIIDNIPDKRSFRVVQYFLNIKKANEHDMEYKNDINNLAKAEIL